MARWVRCRCPKCHHPTSKVVSTKEADGGVLVRLRRCCACEAAWYTAQEPEYVIPRAAVKHVGPKGHKTVLMQQE